MNYRSANVKVYYMERALFEKEKELYSVIPNFIDYAEQQGNEYSIRNFEEALNSQEIDTQKYVFRLVHLPVNF